MTVRVRSVIRFVAMWAAELNGARNELEFTHAKFVAALRALSRMEIPETISAALTLHVMALPSAEDAAGVATSRTSTRFNPDR